MDRVNIRDVTHEADVSITTISAVLNNYLNVKPEIKKRIAEIVQA